MTASLAMNRLFSSVLPLLFLAACQISDFGILAPEIGGEVEQGNRPAEAVVKSGGVSATISAKWALETPQSADILYINQSKAPVSIALVQLVLHHRMGEAPLWNALDLTGTNRGTNNVPPRKIYDQDDPKDQSMRLVIKPGEQRHLSITFTPFPISVYVGGVSDRIHAGDRVTMTVPLGSRDATIPFIAK